MTLVICALREELRGFARRGVEVVAVGVGPVEAALGTARALATRSYRCAVNAGIGGAFAGRASVGAAVAVTVEHYVELGREDEEPLALPSGAQLTASVSSDTTALECVRGVAGITLGPGVTSATITTSDARAARLAARYAPHTESMEGFAFLRATVQAGVPGLELRGISNIVGDRNRNGWDFRAGSAAAVRALNAFFDVVEGSA